MGWVLGSVMPRYDFRCPRCGYVHEVSVRSEWRDELHLDCPEDGERLERMPTAGMAVLWSGKFHDRALQKTDYDGLGDKW